MPSAAGLTEDMHAGASKLSRKASEDSRAMEKGRQEMATALTAVSPSHEAMLKVAYRSTGLGVYAVAMRCAGMPLERLAMVLNSSQVSGASQFGQACKIVFADGTLAPYRNVGRVSCVAWFLQYSVMGCVFQICDRSLASLFGVRCMPYGEELMRQPDASVAASGTGGAARAAAVVVMAPAFAGMIESSVSNRAEAQRFYGMEKLELVERGLDRNAVVRQLGPGFAANAARNFIMAGSSFVLTPVLYQRFYPQERKDANSLFWFGLGINIFAGNVIAITQQALWGRALDYAVSGPGGLVRPINYAVVIRDGLANEGISAFFTPTKWGARVMMNAPVQGTLPWFYNEILPLGEPSVLGAFRKISAALRGEATL